LEFSGEIPFDPKRLILGCFKPLYTMGRERDVAFHPLRTFLLGRDTDCLGSKATF